MSFDIFNFLPGWKRPITLAVGVLLFGWHEAAVAGYISDVPEMLYYALGLFGFNALAHGPKNDAAAASADPTPQ